MFLLAHSYVWRFQRNLANFPEHTIHQLGRSGRCSLCLRPHLPPPPPPSLGWEVLKERVYIPSTWCFISAWASGLAEGLCPAHSARSPHTGPRVPPGKLPVLLASGMCRTRAPGLEWVTAEPCCLGCHPSLLLLLNQGKVEEGQATWEYAQLPPSTPGFFHTHTYFMFVLRQHQGK